MEDPESLWCPASDSLPEYIKLPNEDGTSEDVYYSVAYKGIPPEFRAVAEKELNETEENKVKGLRKLRDFIKREHLPDVSDNVLITILRASKYNFKKSETKLKKWTKARESIVSQMERLDIETVERIIDDGGFGVLPYRDKHGRTIMFTRPASMDDDAYTKDQVMLTVVACSIVFLSYPLTTVVGIDYIGDGKYKTASSFIRLLHPYHQHMWTFLDIPMRVARVEVTNPTHLMRWFITVVRPFLSTKIGNRICLHGSDLSHLTKIYHPDILPDEFGGNMGPVDTSYCKKMTLNFMKKLKAESQALKEAKEKPK